MDIEIKSDQLEELTERLTDVQGRIAEFQTGTEVSANEFFAPSFMQKYTEFESFEEFCEHSPRNPGTGEELAAISDTELNSFIQETTEFESWQAMQARGAEEEIISQLTY
jgi:hypothetical protein